jgi:hypothetical protein
MWAFVRGQLPHLGLLKEVLLVGESTNHETIREHLQAIAERMEAELGEERPCDPFARRKTRKTSNPFRMEP